MDNKQLAHELTRLSASYIGTLGHAPVEVGDFTAFLGHLVEWLEPEAKTEPDNEVAHRTATTAEIMTAPYGDRDMNVITVLDSAEAELAFAKKKFPLWPFDPLHATAIIAEEVGELQKAVLQHIYEPNKEVSHTDIREEAVQSIAMLVRFVAAMDKGHYEWNNRRQSND